jgi:hypothetical protein
VEAPIATAVTVSRAGGVEPSDAAIVERSAAEAVGPWLRTYVRKSTPRTRSMVKNHCPSSQISSPSPTRFGWRSPWSKRNSFLKRASASAFMVPRVFSAVRLRCTSSNAS